MSTSTTAMGERPDERFRGPTGSSGRGILIHGLRAGALAVWGQPGLDALIAALPPASRAETVTSMVLPVSWVDEQHVIAWWTAAWEGPAHRRETDWNLFLDRMMDHGFGSVRKAFLRFATPKILVKQAAALWRHDHTHGELVAEFDERLIICHLRNHVYSRDELSRKAIAEIFRYSVTLTGARNVRVTQDVDSGGDLQVRLSWG